MTNVSPALDNPVRSAGLVDRLAAVPGREDRLRHLEVLPARPARHGEWPAWVGADVVTAYERRGVHRPWTHQVTAADAARAGQHVVLATGTASGKSLGYQAPALTAIEEGRGPRGQRGASVLYLAPTKALAQDQLAGITALGLDVRVTTHDGDSSREQRDWARDHGEYVLTNPDMLHHSLLPSHSWWAPFLGSLRYVVVDECHHYRGVFGAHVAHVLRRLRRICATYGAAPTFVLASATVAEPELAAHRLTGLDFLAVTDDASPRGQVSLALWEPPFTSLTGENGAPVRRAASSETADLLADLVLEDVRTLAFIRSRRGAEQVALTAAGLLAEVDAVAAGQGGVVPRWLPPRGTPGDRGGAAQRGADRAGRDQRPRARHRHQWSRRGADGRLPRHPGSPVAAGRPGRARGSGRTGGAGRPRRPPRHLPRHPSRRLARTTRRGHRLRPVQPARPRATPVCRGARGAADRGRPAALRTDRTVRRRRPHRGRTAATPTARLVLDRPAPGQRPRRPALHRRCARSSSSRLGPAG